MFGLEIVFLISVVYTLALGSIVTITDDIPDNKKYHLRRVYK